MPEGVKWRDKPAPTGRGNWPGEPVHGKPARPAETWRSKPGGRAAETWRGEPASTGATKMAAWHAQGSFAGPVSPSPVSGVRVVPVHRDRKPDRDALAPSTALRAGAASVPQLRPGRRNRAPQSRGGQFMLPQPAVSDCAFCAFFFTVCQTHARPKVSY